MAKYYSVEEARDMKGLRLVVTAHVPGLWSEAAKSLFDAKGVDYVLVEQVVGGENAALKEWTAQTSGPCAVYEDEHPRSTWLEQLYLAERLAPEPPLIPADLDDRLLMFGLCNELCSEKGFGWNMRLRTMHRTMNNPDAAEMSRRVTPKLASKYRYDAGAAETAHLQMAAIVRKLRQLLAEQNERGRTYLVGNTLSAIDIYWAIFAGAIRPLPASLCPGMPDGMRANYTNPELEEEAGPALMSHRDFVYQTHLKLPMDFA